ncbi:hypothetical protein EDD16DRAFT_1588637 [Pisolithus croceorrhizus]|nr:hypothetical protein EDD16DRAFT_1588637 [Pisolithus croceorrhizus]KAI6125187.1 hypothetical protein EV401DRAFT_1939704 [Pisolithus croceorrhizus]
MYFLWFGIEDYKTSSQDHLLDGIVNEHTRRGVRRQFCANRTTEVPLQVRDRSFFVMELHFMRRTVYPQAKLVINTAEIIQWSSRGCKQCGASKDGNSQTDHPPCTLRNKFCRGWTDLVERCPFRENQQIETDAFDERFFEGTVVRDILGVIFVGLQVNVHRCADHHFVHFFLFNGTGTSPRFRLCCNLSSAWVDHINARSIASLSLTIGSGACICVTG